VPVTGQDTLNTRRTLDVGGQRYDYFSLAAAAEGGLGDLSRLPFSLKVLLENLLRFEDGHTVTVDHIQAMAAWLGEPDSAVAAGNAGREVVERNRGATARTVSALVGLVKRV